MDAALEQRVRERAYEIWKSTGLDGQSADLNWLSAEQAVRNELKAATGTSAHAGSTAKKAPKAATKVTKTATSVKTVTAKSAAPRKPAKTAMAAHA